MSGTENTGRESGQSSSVSRGTELELRVLSLLQRLIQANRFFAKPESCRVFHRKPYYSRDRRAEIVFDIAIEVSIPGIRIPSMVCLIECKHYEHPVPVSDVEEFFAKVQQVAAANSKAILASTNSFQRGAIEFAQAKGIGLLRVFPTAEFKWILHRSASSLPMARSLSQDAEVWRALTEEHYKSARFDCFCTVGELFMYSLPDFLGKVIVDALDPISLDAIAAERHEVEAVPFLSGDEIEQRCHAVHAAIRYFGGVVPLDCVCEWQQRNAGLTITIGAAPSREEFERGILGRISFNPPSITIFRDRLDSRRQRFTLAHELGHLALGHGTYLEAESVDAMDIEKADRAGGDVQRPECGDWLADDDIRRLEWQANCFASCLLLPRNQFIASAMDCARQLNITDRGHGLLYLDQQPVNTRNYRLFTDALMQAYDVSRTAVSIRLKGLGLLHYQAESFNTLRAPL
jgi:hypothetical protein